MDDEVLDELRKQAEYARKHAPGFTWHNRSPEGKSIAEWGVDTALIEAMRESGELEYHTVVCSSDSWPDCWVCDATGERIPVEVTELVDHSALPDRLASPWSDEAIVAGIKHLVEAKDVRSEAGRGVRRSLLVIHTDEPCIEPEQVSRAIESVRFALPAATIRRAFLLFGYRRSHYPFLELPLRGEE